MSERVIIKCHFQFMVDNSSAIFKRIRREIHHFPGRIKNQYVEVYS